MQQRLKASDTLVLLTPHSDCPWHPVGPTVQHGQDEEEEAVGILHLFCSFLFPCGDAPGIGARAGGSIYVGIFKM